MEWKKKLGLEIVKIYHSQKDAEKVQAEFEKVFSKKELPEKIEVFHLKSDKPTIWIAKLLTESGLCSSTSEARRLIKQGGVYIDNQRVEDENLQVQIKGEKLLKVGKRKFLKVLPE